jgi:phage antirepressor YoqD-like protein
MPYPHPIFLLLPSGYFIKEEYSDFNVLTFQMMDICFIAVVGCEEVDQLNALGESISTATGFKWDKLIIRGWEHNKEVEQYNNSIAELREDEFMLQMPTA